MHEIKQKTARICILFCIFYITYSWAPRSGMLFIRHLFLSVFTTLITFLLFSCEFFENENRFLINFTNINYPAFL